jgi:hypothetical protein
MPALWRRIKYHPRQCPTCPFHYQRTDGKRRGHFLCNLEIDKPRYFSGTTQRKCIYKGKEDEI